MAQRVDDRVVDGRDRPDRAGLADALGAEGVDERRRLHRHEVERRQLGRRDHGVVGEVGGPRLAVGVVVHLLEQRLGDALGDAAVHLAFRQQRVDERAGVVDGDVLAQPHRSPSRCRPRRRRRGCRTGTSASAGRSRARRRGGRRRHRRGRPSRGCSPACRRRGSGRPSSTTSPTCASKRSAARSRAASTSCGGRRGEGGAAELHRPRPDGQPAGRNGVGVAVDDLDALDRHAGGVGDDHRPRGRRGPGRTASPRCGRAGRRPSSDLDGGVLRARQRRR